MFLKHVGVLQFFFHVSSSSTMDNFTSASASYQMNAMNLNRNSMYTNNDTAAAITAGDAGGACVGTLMSAEEIRVECFLITADGKYIVTGSLCGPPQVWDIRVSSL